MPSDSLRFDFYSRVVDKIVDRAMIGWIVAVAAGVVVAAAVELLEFELLEIELYCRYCL